MDFAILTLQNLRLNAKSSRKPLSDDNSNKANIDANFVFQAVMWTHLKAKSSPAELLKVLTYFIMIMIINFCGFI